MDKSIFQTLLAIIDDLIPEQKEEIKKAIDEIDSFKKVVSIIDSRILSDLKCKHCKSIKVKKWGIQSGLQRFMCMDCNRTFNSLTGTSLAHLRKKEQWLNMAIALKESISIKNTAERCTVAISTAFRWRHRFLAPIQQDSASKLDGIAEADETYFLESFKGQRNLTRPSRKRGGKAKSPGLSREQVPVLIARDRVGAIIDAVLTDKTTASITQVLFGKVGSDNILCIDGGNALWGFVNAQKIQYRIIAPSKHVHEQNPVFHIQNVNAYHSRLKEWIKRFHGVATKYLPNYLGWRRMFERPNTVLSSTAWVQAAVG
ncbi:MAG: IS1595 family transposase [Desulfovermiculus sp.]|nr:IS1595 family transposase [Desulfovermiculus sp.]